MPVDTRRRPPSPDMNTAPPPKTQARTATRKNSGRTSGGSAKQRRRKDPLWARLLVIFGAVLMVTSGIAVVGSKLAFQQATSGIEQANLVGDSGKSAAEGGQDLKGPIDLLLLGVDARERWSADDVRSDSIIILHIPASHDQAYLISIPRDTEANIPAWKKSGFTGGTDKINAAFQAGARNGGGWVGGAQLMAKTITNMTGIKFDGAAIINFGGFKNIIDALGTVRICVKQEVESHHMSYVDGKPMWNADAKKTGRPRTPVVHKKGCREMQGWEALDYSRQRYGLDHGDYDRQQNQQQLIKAMANKAKQDGVLTDLPKLKKLMDAAGKALLLDTGGVPIDQFVFTFRNINAAELTLLRTNGGSFSENANGREVFNETTRNMFEALQRDKLAEFVYSNPTVISDRS